MRSLYLTAGILLLLVGSYLDNIRGPLLPVFTRSLGISYGQTSWFLILGNFLSVLMIYLLIPSTERWGEKRVTIGVCGLGALGLCAAAGVQGYPTLLLLAATQGTTLAMLGAISNVWVYRGSDLESRGRWTCGQQSVYGWASLFAPALAGLVLARGYSWQGLVLGVVPVLLAIGWAMQVLIPDDFRAGAASGSERSASGLSFGQATIVACLSIYVAAEAVSSMWMVTYLVESRGFTVAQAAPYLAGFFVVLGATRLLCFLVIRPHWEIWVLWGCLLLAAGFFFLGHFGWSSPLAFSLAGCLGPFFPLYLARVSRNFPEQSRSLTLWCLLGAQLSLGMGHLTVGRLIDRFGVERTYLLPLGLMALTVVTFCLYLWGERPPTLVVKPAVLPAE